MAIWADYSGGRPNGASLRNAGFIGVIRYVGIGGLWKRLTAAEYKDLTAHQLQVLTIAENSGADAEGGYSAGRANAQAAQADITNLGLPGNTLIFAGVDSNKVAASDAVDYVHGFRDVLGVARTGVYGFDYVINAVKADGSASVFWQAGHPPAPGAGVHFWQRNGSNGEPASATVDGVTCDIDDQLLPLPGAPGPTSYQVVAYQHANVRETPHRSGKIVSYVMANGSYPATCWTAGDQITDNGITNDVWIRLPLHAGGFGYVSAIYLRGDKYANLPSVASC